MSVMPLRTLLSWPSMPRASMCASISISIPSSGTPNMAALVAVPLVREAGGAVCGVACGDAAGEGGQHHLDGEGRGVAAAEIRRLVHHDREAARRGCHLVPPRGAPA